MSECTSKRMLELEILLAERHLEYLNFVRVMYEKGLVKPSEYAVKTSFNKEREKMFYQFPIDSE